MSGFFAFLNYFSNNKIITILRKKNAKLKEHNKVKRFKTVFARKKLKIIARKKVLCVFADSQLENEFPSEVDHLFDIFGVMSSYCFAGW